MYFLFLISIKRVNSSETKIRNICRHLHRRVLPTHSSYPRFGHTHIYHNLVFVDHVVRIVYTHHLMLPGISCV